MVCCIKLYSAVLNFSLMFVYKAAVGHGKEHQVRALEGGTDWRLARYLRVSPLGGGLQGWLDKGPHGDHVS